MEGVFSAKTKQNKKKASKGMTVYSCCKQVSDMEKNHEMLFIYKLCGEFAVV